MTWEWIVIVGGIYFVIQAIGEVERNAARSADSLIRMEASIQEMTNAIAQMESDVNALRRQVAPELKPWTEKDV